mmetsp:Transcript_61625/g.74132  ORF Transcript_61625/g.74132 Transcript_61625/m.74132 type:complete len:326 (+) Transcript_61625:41-1018(+)
MTATTLRFGVFICYLFSFCDAFKDVSIKRNLLSHSLPKESVQLKKATLYGCELCAKRRGRDSYDDEDDYFDDEDDDFYEDEARLERKRRRRNRERRGNGEGRTDLGGGKYGSSNDPGVGLNLDIPSPFGKSDGWRLPESVSKALLAGVFVFGVGTGVTVDSQINTSPKDLASRDAIDQAAPNPTICSQYGASAMAFDQRVFVSFNPFNVYVAQADVKPACVLNPANAVPILKQRGLINDKEVRTCKDKMNTWAFVGALDSVPQLSCVYQSEDAQNEFLSDPKLGIGEDVWDDDRASGSVSSTGKLIKNAKKNTELRKSIDDTRNL